MKLEAQKVSFAYGTQPVLREVSFQLQSGDFLSVLGPNGVGKTTLFKCILGILSDYTGDILSGDTNLRSCSARKLADLIAYIPQISRPAFGYTVLDTVLMGTSHLRSPFSSPRREQIEMARSALEQISIGHLYDRNFANLSGGEQQLVLVARALAQQSDILVMDEPTASLDYGNQLRVLEKVCSLTQNGYTVLLSTHNPQHALTFSNRVLALQGGRAAAFGETSEILTPELIRQLYGIEVEFVQTVHGRAIMPMRIPTSTTAQS